MCCAFCEAWIRMDPAQRTDILRRANPCPSPSGFYLVPCLACSLALWPWVYCAQEDYRIMLLEDGSLSDFRICSITAMRP